MKREIKFRVKGTSGDCLWFYSDSIKKMWTGLDQIAGQVIDWETLSQFTGLKDKNGVEIYEGDMVRVHSTFSSSMEEKDKTGVVEMFGGSWTIGKTTKGYLVYHVNYSNVANIYGEVLGNIYENPELLD